MTVSSAAAAGRARRPAAQILFVRFVRFVRFAPASLRDLQRSSIEAIARCAGDRHREPNRLRNRQLREQGREEMIELVLALRGVHGRGCIEHEHELAALPIRVGAHPSESVAKPAAVDGFEALGQLARNREHPLG